MSSFCRLMIYFQNQLVVIFSEKKSFGNISRVSTSLDPDLARRFVGPDQGPNCLQML